MDTLKRLIASVVFIAPLSVAWGEDATSASVEALKTSLGNSARGFEVDNVRVTDAGVSCIDYRVRNEQGGESRAHAVVQGEDVLRSTLGNKKLALSASRQGCCKGNG